MKYSTDASTLRQQKKEPTTYGTHRGAPHSALQKTYLKTMQFSVCGIHF